MRLSKNFTLKEFTKSMTATRLGIDNTPQDEHLVSAVALFENCVQKIREHWGITRISSGYRSPALNEAIGGSTTSQHSKGQAVDFECDGTDNLEVAKWIRDNLDFDQMIWEFGTDKNPNWLHISWVSHRPNRKKLTIAKKVDGRTRYIHEAHK